jgi:hypothetical protein
MEQKILLADDESSLRRSLSAGMSQEGYVVEPCENGINSLKKTSLPSYFLENFNEDENKDKSVPGSPEHLEKEHIKKVHEHTHMNTEPKQLPFWEYQGLI